METPSENKVLALLDDLIKGRVTPVEVALWAEKLSYSENEKISEWLCKNKPALSDLIDSLSLAGAVNEKSELLYGVEDYKDWLAEYKHQLKSLS